MATSKQLQAAAKQFETQALGLAAINLKAEAEEALERAAQIRAEADKLAEEEGAE